MNDDDISYEICNKKFNFRVGVFIYDDENCIFEKSKSNDYYSLIGGRVKIGENTEETAIREVFEETGIKLNKPQLKLINVIENFFTFRDKKFHEVLFIYKYKLNNISAYANTNVLDKDNTKIKMIKLNELKLFNLKPDLIKEFKCSQKLKHYINNGEK